MLTSRRTSARKLAIRRIPTTPSLPEPCPSSTARSSTPSIARSSDASREPVAGDAHEGPVTDFAPRSSRKRAKRHCCIARRGVLRETRAMRSGRHLRPRPAPASAFALYRFPPDVITLAVRWYLRFGLSYRDVEELLAERGIEVDHVSIYRWVHRFAPE